MRESCSCGAAVHALSYHRIKEWRQQHRCNPMTLLQALDNATQEAFDGFIFIDDEEEDQ